MFGEIFSGLCLIVVAIIEARATRDRKEAKEYRAAREEKEKAREEKEKAREDLMVSVVETGWASIALSEATAHAMQRGHTNGDMEAALVYATKVKHKQKELLTKQGIHMIWD